MCSVAQALQRSKTVQHSRHPSLKLCFGCINITRQECNKQTSSELEWHSHNATHPRLGFLLMRYTIPKWLKVTWSFFEEIKSLTCKFFQLLVGSGPQTAGPAAWRAHVTGEPLAEAASRYRALPQNVLDHLQDRNRHLWDTGQHKKNGRRKGTRTKVALTFWALSIVLAQNVLEDWGQSLNALLFGLVLI